MAPPQNIIPELNPVMYPSFSIPKRRKHFEQEYVNLMNMFTTIKNGKRTLHLKRNKDILYTKVFYKFIYRTFDKDNELFNSYKQTYSPENNRNMIYNIIVQMDTIKNNIEKNNSKLAYAESINLFDTMNDIEELINTLLSND